MACFVSTRDMLALQKGFGDAILSPCAASGGLYTLKSIPKVDFKEFLDFSYEALCVSIFKCLNLEIEESILKDALNLYKNFDSKDNPAPISKLENAFFLELYHGPTRSFKDMALVPFGEIFTQMANSKNQNFLILTATSGDTGPATLASFANKKNIKVICLYPKGGTSQIQELQMITNDAPNLKIFGIEGNFDDAQNILKSLLADNDFTQTLAKNSYFLSAANSVNFGRITFQIIYHIWGYLCLVRQNEIQFGESIDIIVPSGNFGNALGAFFAKKMGLCVDKIIIASNKNNILTELINSGIYDISSKSLQKSISPAMDILKSSNVERVLFALFGDVRTRELMQSLANDEKYALTKDELQILRNDFNAWWGDDDVTKELIKKAFKAGYILDPHTALGFGAYLELCANNNKKALICSTAEWSKFAPSVVESIFGEKLGDFKAIEKMLQNGATTRESIKNLATKQICHKEILNPSDVKDGILNWLSND